ncbi:MAG: hypothetical protein LBK57_07195 [Clostridiales Family XIII bacterium]|nr:hypothetical protein [Clostridiales Family XIII bacterium]
MMKRTTMMIRNDESHSLDALYGEQATIPAGIKEGVWGWTNWMNCADKNQK